MTTNETAWGPRLSPWAPRPIPPGSALSPIPTPGAWTQFDRWAGALLMLLAILAVVVSILVTSTTREPIIVGAILVAGFAAAAIHVVAVYGLSVGRTWARPVAVTLLWLAIVNGLVEMALALTNNGGINIPLGAIAAVLVLRMRPAERSPWPEGQWRPVAAAVAVVLLAVALPRGADYLLRPGNSPLSVAPDALQLTATLECVPSAGAPAEIRMTATWRWTERELLPHGVDALAFRWYTPDPHTVQSNAPWLYELKAAPGTGFAITEQGAVKPGREGATGPFWLGDENDIIRELAQEAEQQGALVEPVMIEIDRQQLRDDQFLMVLAPTEFAPAHGMFALDVAYVHAGRWTVWSDPAVSCAW